MTGELRTQLVEALAHAYNADVIDNPEWDRRHAVNDVEYERTVPHVIPATVEEMEGRTPYVVSRAADGDRSTWVPSLGEIADVLLPVILEPLREEQVNLWSDLNDAVEYAQTKPPVIPGRWSLQCNWVAERIVTNARLVGAVSWQHLQAGLLLSGIYEKVLHDAGIPHAPVNWDQVRDLFNRNHQWTGENWDGPPVDLIGGAQ